MKKSTFVAMIPGTVSSVFFSLGMCNEIMMAKSKLIKANEKIAETVTGGYKKIENGAVDGFGKVVDKCVEVLFAKDGESVEDAKKRLSPKEEEK